MRQIPNLLTFLRIALIPLFVFLMINPSDWERVLATLIFVFAALTDLADGLIARRYKVVSDLGKLLDPLADKMMVMAALVMLVGMRDDIYGELLVPAWMVVMLLAREIWVTGLRGLAANRGLVVAASASGKLKSFLQMVAIVGILLHEIELPLPAFMNTAGALGLNLLLLSIVISYWGALEYTLLVLGGESWVPELRSAARLSPQESSPTSISEAKVEEEKPVLH